MPTPSKMDNSDNLISKIKPRIHPNGHEENESVHSRQQIALGIGSKPEPIAAAKVAASSQQESVANYE